MYSLVTSQDERRSGRTLSTEVMLKTQCEPNGSFDDGEIGMLEQQLDFMTEDKEMRRRKIQVL